MEKIFYTINNYFSSLEAAAGSETADVEAAPLDQAEAGVSEENQTEPAPADQSGEGASFSDISEQAPGTDEPVESGQNLEASIISGGVESAPPADEAEVNSDEPHPGEDHPTPEKQ